MAKVTILGRGLDPEDIQALLNLLQDTGKCEGGIEVVAAVGDPPQDDHLAVVVVLGTPNTCDDPQLEGDLIKAHNTGQSVVWVWPEGSEEFERPPAAKKYCYSVVAWDIEMLAAVLADDDVVCFVSGAGVPLDSVETERNCCVEEERKVKLK